MDELINSFSELLDEVKTVMRDEQGVADQKQVWTRESHLSFFDRRPLITFSCIQSVAADLESYTYYVLLEAHLPSRFPVQWTSQ